MSSPRMKTMERKIALLEDRVAALLAGVSLILVHAHMPKELRHLLTTCLEESLGAIKAAGLPPANGGRPCLER